MKKQSKTINQTFSLPVDISQDLHAYVKRREMSRFVAEAIRKELMTKKDELRQVYLMANEDEGQAEATHDWQRTLGDGSEEW